MIECKNDSLYTGITDNLDRRFQEHAVKKGGHYTKCNSVARMIHSEEFASRFEAARRERQIKGWSRAKKLALVNGNLSLLKQL